MVFFIPELLVSEWLYLVSGGHEQHQPVSYYNGIGW